MVEDFTHVLPEDKSKPPIVNRFAEQIFDLKEANERAQYFRQLRQRMEDTERKSRERFKTLLNSKNNSCNL